MGTTIVVPAPKGCAGISEIVQIDAVTFPSHTGGTATSERSRDHGESSSPDAGVPWTQACPLLVLLEMNFGGSLGEGFRKAWLFVKHGLPEERSAPGPVACEFFGILALSCPWGTVRLVDAALGLAA